MTVASENTVPTIPLEADRAKLTRGIFTASSSAALGFSEYF